jgi:Transcriptional regulator, effector-binding domain/component
MQRLGCECPEPQYCFTIDYNDNYGEEIDIEYFEAVKERGVDSDIIKFKELPEVTALCINHYGSYDKFPDTFSKLYMYAEQNGYEISDYPRFSYIDGIWNKESVDEWLTEIQLPIK